MLAGASRDDWVLSQITNKPYGDPIAVRLESSSFAVGSLRVTSFARPTKLFTANRGLIVTQVRTLRRRPLEQVIDAVLDLMRKSLTV